MQSIPDDARDTETSLHEHADAVIARMGATGYRVEQIATEPAIINVYNQDSEGDDGYLFTLTVSVTP